MYRLLEEEISKYNIFNGEPPVAVRALAKAIPITTIPQRMKYALAASELVVFASQFRRNILHWNGSHIPINAITFTLSQSGSGKDMSVQSLRKCFATAYSLIQKKREEAATARAVSAAAKDGIENPRDPKIIKKYYRAPNPIFVAPSTAEGYIQHLNDLSEDPLGAGVVFANELGSELASSPVMIQLIQLLSETYDTGSKQVKMLKNREQQSKEVSNMPVSALLIGSQGNILYDERIKAIFKMEFNTKLARRSFFNFNPEHIKPPNFKTVTDLLAHDRRVEEEAIKVNMELDIATMSLAEHHIPLAGIPLTIDPEVQDLFSLYKNYNYYKAEQIDSQLPISKLVRLHAQWRALKLSGAIAIFAMHDSITVDDYVQAMSFTELLDTDIQLFELELEKEKYELFVSYMHSITTSDKSNINLHQLRKLGYIPTTGSPEQKVKELVQLASAYDTDGIYTVCKKGVCFERIVQTEANGISYRTVSGSKEDRAVQCAYGFEFSEVNFSDLSNLLTGDYAYSPFRFKNGVRNKDNIDSGCKWLCLDIDKSIMTDEETHYILQGFNHHIVRTSDANNPFKFRVLLELDAYIDIEDRIWKTFIKSVAEYLQLTPDILPKSQIFFSYSNRNILSVTDKSPIPVKEHLMIAHSMQEARGTVTLSSAQKKAAVSNLRETLFYAYEAADGQGSVSLVRAMHHMHTLELSLEEAEVIIRDINDYWVEPLEAGRFERTIIAQLPRIFL